MRSKRSSEKVKRMRSVSSREEFAQSSDVVNFMWFCESEPTQLVHRTQWHNWSTLLWSISYTLMCIPLISIQCTHGKWTFVLSQSYQSLSFQFLPIQRTACVNYGYALWFRSSLPPDLIPLFSLWITSKRENVSSSRFPFLILAVLFFRIDHLEQRDWCGHQELRWESSLSDIKLPLSWFLFSLSDSDDACLLAFRLEIESNTTNHYISYPARPFWFHQLFDFVFYWVWQERLPPNPIFRN